MVSDSSCIFKDTTYLLKAVESAIKGGVDIVQLREKDLDSLSFFNKAFQLKTLCQKYNIPFLINDRIDIAQAVDADGVHIGQEDIPLPFVRQILGQDKIIGVSVKTIVQAKLAQNQGANYIGSGALFKTTTKKNPVYISFDEFKAIQASVNIPVIAIGGIDVENLDEVLRLKPSGVAVVRAILAHNNPFQISKDFKNKLQA